jgi:hypothetical protein
MIPARARVPLERGPAADVMRHTLSQIPTVFGRLVYLSSIRNITSGRYTHHGLALVYGEDEADAALRKCHMQAFEEWINFGLERQKADLDLYLAALRQSKRSILATWQKLRPYEQLLPASVRRPTERRLYLADFDALIRLMSHEYGVSSDPDA